MAALQVPPSSVDTRVETHADTQRETQSPAPVRDDASASDAVLPSKLKPDVRQKLLETADRLHVPADYYDAFVTCLLDFRRDVLAESRAQSSSRSASPTGIPAPESASRDPGAASPQRSRTMPLPPPIEGPFVTLRIVDTNNRDHAKGLTNVYWPGMQLYARHFYEGAVRVTRTEDKQFVDLHVANVDIARDAARFLGLISQQIFRRGVPEYPRLAVTAKDAVQMFQLSHEWQSDALREGLYHQFPQLFQQHEWPELFTTPPPAMMTEEHKQAWYMELANLLYQDVSRFDGLFAPENLSKIPELAMHYLFEHDGLSVGEFKAFEVMLAWAKAICSTGHEGMHPIEYLYKAKLLEHIRWEHMPRTDWLQAIKLLQAYPLKLDLVAHISSVRDRFEANGSGDGLQIFGREILPPRAAEAQSE